MNKTVNLRAHVTFLKKYILACHTEAGAWQNKLTEEETPSAEPNPFSDAWEKNPLNRDQTTGRL